MGWLMLSTLAAGVALDCLVREVMVVVALLAVRAQIMGPLEIPLACQYKAEEAAGPMAHLMPPLHREGLHHTALVAVAEAQEERLVRIIRAARAAHPVTSWAAQVAPLAAR